MRIAPGGVCLPDLDQRIVRGHARILEDISDKLDALALGCVTLAMARHLDIVSRRVQVGPRAKIAFADEISAAAIGQAKMKERPGRLPGGLPRHAQCSIGVASRPRSTKSNK